MRPPTAPRLPALVLAVLTAVISAPAQQVTISFAPNVIVPQSRSYVVVVPATISNVVRPAVAPRVELTRVDVDVAIFEQRATTVMDISLRNPTSSCQVLVKS